MVSDPPGATLCAPEGDTVPLGPAEAVMVQPARQTPEMQ